MSPSRRTLDVHALPEVAHGSRAPLWWGVVLMITIESTMFVLAIASYFYIRGNNRVWPPTPMGDTATWAATIGAAVLLLSVAPMKLCTTAAKQGRLRPMRAWLIVSTGMFLAHLATRVVEFRTLLFRWDSHAHGSIFWVSLGLHTFHGISTCLENMALIALLFRGPVEEEHHVDVEVSGLYGYFVIAVGLTLYAVLYLEPRVMP